MRQAQEIRVRPGAQKSSSTSLPAPIGGLNARDSLANMRGEDAIILENWFPKTTSVDVRAGYIAWATFTGVPQTIVAYNGVSATKIFIAVKNGSTFSLFDGTTVGAKTVPVAGGAGPTVQALTSTRFDYVNFGTTGGQYAILVNGVDVPLQYDGTTWIASTMSGGGSTPANFFTAGVFQRRLWFGAKNSFDVYYNVIDTLTGAGLLKLNLGPLFKLGGYLNSIITVTDASQGLVDYIGFLSSEGEIVAFTGIDPSDATNWTLAAHFRIGRPVIKGNRCWTKWGSDALVLCADGVYPLRSAITEQDRKSSGLAVSDKIRNLINADVAEHGSKYGWQLTVHPTGGKLIVNVPTSEDISAFQYVMNTQTNSWCKFTGWKAFCFETARDTLYMGLNGKMVKGDTGATDGGAVIGFDALQAYNYFSARGLAKHMKLARPILAADGAFSISVTINVDYRSQDPSSYRTVSSGQADPFAAAWDVAWQGEQVAITNWYGVGGIGHALAPRVKGMVSGTRLSWSATDLVYERGGVLA